MQSVSGGFTAGCAAVGLRPVSFLEVSWDGTGTLGAARGAAGWTNETAYLERHSGDLNLNAPSERRRADLVKPGEVGRLSLVMSNTTQRFSWLRTDGPLYANIGGAGGPIGKRVRLWQGLVISGSAEYVRIFSGVIAEWAEDSSEGTVTFQVRDMGWEYAQQQRSSSIIYADYLTNEWITALATLAGIAEGDQVLDAGIYRIPFVWLDDEALVNEMWDTAMAEGGRAYFDQLGKLRFENMVHWVMTPHNTVQWAFAEDQYQVLDPVYSSDDLATKVVVEYLPRAIGTETVLYTMRQMRTAAPGETEEFEARFTYPAWEMIDPQASGDPVDYRVVSAGGYNMASDVTLTLTDTYAQKTTATLDNNSASLSAALVYLQIRGYPLLGGPIEQVEVDVASPAVGFNRDREVRGNPYMQTWAQANALAQFLAVKCARVRPLWRLRGGPGLPQLELGDRVSFASRRLLGAGVTREGYVTAIRWEGSAAGFWQEIGVLDAEGLYDYSDWFIIGTTALGAVGRCWH